MSHIPLTDKRWFTRTFVFLIPILVCAGILALSIQSEYSKLESDDPIVWESVIKNFEKEDRAYPAPKQAVLFTGSSSIRFWRNLDEDMYPTKVINRGFGGAKIRDIIYYADRIIFPYKPKAIVLFAGTNDISGRANDKTPEKVLQDFRELAELIQQQLPGCHLYYLPITPTTARWLIWPQADKANKLIQSYMATSEHLHYIDITHLFLTKEGTPDKDLLWWDGVHLNSQGYDIWEREIKCRLHKDLLVRY